MVSDKPTADSIFLAAVERQPEQRAAYLTEACGDDRELLARVERLLQAQSHIGSFLESPAPELGATVERTVTEKPGTVIGPYKLLQQIGEGGMGVVFMAEQTEPIQRTVALKIIKPGMDTRQVIARFEAERQAVAMMDHPNIAKVLDAGTTESGRPYFVMELVKGVPITKYCDEKHLPLPARLELFVQVCQAVQHAHQKGIIHRDIKATNVLVAEYDNRAVPKIIDFGVAKATAQRLTERTMFTEFGQVIGTVEYMSPEQAKFNQLDIDTRSDIYSLGVLLYELLTGSTPFEHERLREAAFDEVLRIIREEEPPKPSTRLSTSETLPSIAANRHTEPARLSRDVSGELDWIVMKCLEKDRNRRYETASAMAADIERYLQDEPVQACPPSAVYRFRKFARRNLVALSASALIVAALVLGTVVSTWQAIVATTARKQATEAREEATAAQAAAEANFQKALGAVDAMLTQVSEESLAAVPQMELVQRALLEKALAFYQGFLHEKSTDPRVRLETARAYRRVHDIYNSLVQMPEAVKACRKSIAICEELEAQFPNVPTYVEETAQSYFRLGISLLGMWEQVEPTDSESALRQTQTRYMRLAAEIPEQRRYGYSLAEADYRLAQSLWRQKRYEEAKRLFREAIDLHGQLATRFTPTPDDRELLSNQHAGLAIVLQDQERIEEAESEFNTALDLKRKLVADYPDNAVYRRSLALSLHRVGKIFDSRRETQKAEAAFREAIIIQTDLVDEHFHLVFYRFELIRTQRDLWDLLRRDDERIDEAKDQFERAVAVYRPVIDHREKQVRLYPNERKNHVWLIASHEWFGGLLRDAGQYEHAITSFRNAIAARRRFAVQFSKPESADIGLVLNHVRIADMLKNTNRRDDAIREYRAAGELIRHSYSKLLADVTVIEGCRSVIESLNTSLKSREGDSFDWFFLAMFHQQLGNADEAQKYFAQAVQWIDAHNPNDTELIHIREVAAGLLGITEPRRNSNSTTKD